MADYQLERQQVKAAQQFARGAEAMASALAQEFMRFDANAGGNVSVTCEEVARIIMNAPRPRLPA